MMKWQEIRTKFPQSWVLVEAIEAHTDKSQRVIDRLSVIDRFPGFFEAMDVYKLLHRQTPNREMYVLHTQNEELTIEEHHWLGLRGVRRKFAFLQQAQAIIDLSTLELRPTL